MTTKKPQLEVLYRLSGFIENRIVPTQSDFFIKPPRKKQIQAWMEQNNVLEAYVEKVYKLMK